ncbi:MAG: hypothetical protein H7Y01_00815 [Ferruginibacter sp.]|nr:hypothetical protein [Chitinophagaceae bacterium]
MSKSNFIYVGVTLFLLLAGLIASTQKITQEKGLTTAVFNVPQGTVKVYLPDDIRQGDVISGTVTVTPEGRNEKQLQKNLAELSRYAIVFNGQNFVFDPGSRTTRFTVVAVNSAQNSIALFFDKATIPVQQLNIPAKLLSEQKPAPAQCIIPGHVLSGSPMTIPGPFDGNAANTQCIINNQPATILAESPRSCIVAFPENANGMQATEVKENGQQPCTKDISAVQMNVAAGKLNLQKGESTYIEINITGLQGLPDTALLSLVNLTPDIVVLQPSNTVVVPLVPGAVSSGTYNRRFDVQSIKTGTFVVNCNLDLPDVMLSPGPGDGSGNKCNCNLTVELVKRTTINPRHTYFAIIKKGCSGQNCTEGSFTKKWSIVSGDGDIVDVSHDKSLVTIQPKGKGSFVLQFAATLICSDGSACTAVKHINEKGEEIPGTIGGEKSGEFKILVIGDHRFKLPVDSIPDKNSRSCSRSTAEDILPKMDGGLKMDKEGIIKDAVVVPLSQKIQRDDFIPLVAEGADFDTYIIQCSVTDLCKEGNTVKLVPLSGRVRFEWEITSGPGFGQFVKIGCLFTSKEDGQKTKGEKVIFKPPYLKLPVLSKDTSVVTKIKLSIIDDKETLKDAQVDREFQVITRRSTDSPDEYTIEIVYTDIHTLPTPISKNPDSKCKAFCGGWLPGNGLDLPKILLPDVPDNTKMVLGEWILLEAEDQHESDILPGIICDSGCSGILPFSKDFEDKVQWTWTATGGHGKFIGGSTGRYVIYQAPTFMPDKKKEVKIVFTVTASNEGTIQTPDGKKTSKPITITVYEPGIQMQFPDPDFVPMANNSVVMRSELKYLNGDKWEPGFSHMGRIHFFELMGVSIEKGICMNEPLPDVADECLDLQIQKEKEISLYEAYEANLPGKTNCTLTDQWLKARSNEPATIATIEVSSLDYGSYGFMRSTALGKSHFGKGGLYQYTPVIWTEANVPKLHKEPRSKKLPNYTDNRVTIPLDIDENHIPDKGYPIYTGEVIPDPIGGKMDLDNIPPGDKFKGDGLTNYEEYRGFMYQKLAKQKDGESVVEAGEDLYVRTDHRVKSIFIHNQDHLPLELYCSITKLEVFEISKAQYQGDDIRVVNFNSNPLTNVVKQKGLYLYDGKSDPLHLNRMGMAKTTTGYPARPNEVVAIIIYKEAIQRNIHKTDSIADSWNIDPAVQRKFKNKQFGHLEPKAKLAKTIAHELLHGNAVWHHGEGDDDLDKSHDAMRGLRSGDISCVMRYDNTGTLIKSPLFFPELPGTQLCTSPEGTSYNAPVMIIDGNKNLQVSQRGYGNCLPGRGNCTQQIRISGVDPPPPKK